MASRIVVYLLLIAFIATVDCNSEGDALNAWKTALIDPYNVLQSWDPTLVNPCTWFHITCNIENTVVRVDLGDAGLSGPLVPQLGQLTNLQYLQISNNSFSGVIPSEFAHLTNLLSLGLSHNKLSGPIPNFLGNLTKLFSLGLDHNQLSGSIPSSLGNLKSLQFMRLNSNKLTGTIPISVISLIVRGDLMTLNVSENFLSGTVRTHKPRELAVAITTIIQDPKAPPK